MSTVCKFGYTCRRADCWFSHPEGRAIDGSKGAAPAAVGGGHHAHGHSHAHAAGPAAGGYVLRPNTQNYQVPHSAPHQVHAGAGNAGGAGAAAGAYRSVTRPLTPHSNDAVASSSAGPTITGNTATLSSGSRACKFGRECHRKDCYFSHPDGRNIDDSPHSSVASTPKQYKKRDAATPSEFEFDDDDDDDDGGELDDKKIEALVQAHDWIPTSGNCLCCKGYARDCTNPDCAAVGMCVTCGGGADTAEVVADESWKDEWFAGSRSCPCCEGYVYRCAGKDPACVAKGECFCKSAPAAAATTAKAAVPAAQTAARTGAASASSAAAAAAAAPATVQVPGGPAL